MSRTSIIIVNWNRWKEVGVILELILRKSNLFFEVIVVDNGSNEKPSFKWSHLEKTKFFFLDKNYGPCIARNLGAKEASGEYLLFLDSDAILSRRAIPIIERRFEREKKLGAVGLKICRGFSSELDAWIYSQLPTKKAQIFDTYSFGAGAVMIRRNLFLDIKGYDENIFMHNEEVDLSYRVIMKGYRISYDSRSVIYHFPSTNGREPSFKFWQGMIRHWIWIFFKYYPTFEAYRRSSFYSLIYIIKSIYLGVSPSVILGIYEGFKGRKTRAFEHEKLNREQILYIDSLNKRKKINFGRG